MSTPIHNPIGSKTLPGRLGRASADVQSGAAGSLVPQVAPQLVPEWAWVVAGGCVSLGVALGVALGGFGMTANLGGPVDSVGDQITTIAATEVDGDDFDGDGMTDAQEIVLGSSPTDVDTDFDGYSDVEEFARQSDPLDPSSMPTNDGVSASIAARGENGKLRLVISLHEPTGPSETTLVRIGALAQGAILSVPIDRFLGLSDIRSRAGSDGSTITTIDMPINAAFVHANGRATFFLAAGDTSTMAFGAAAKVDIVSDSGELVIQRPAQVNTSLQASQGGGSIRQPIPVAGPPSQAGGWIPGSICYQRSEVIGINGPRMLHQVVEADCLEGWDSYCSGSCALSLGTTYETIDPLALIGG